jgi:competence protein ComGC
MLSRKRTNDIQKNNQRLNYKIAIIYMLLILLFISIIILL